MLKKFFSFVNAFESSHCLETLKTCPHDFSHLFWQVNGLNVALEIVGVYKHNFGALWMIIKLRKMHGRSPVYIFRMRFNTISQQKLNYFMISPDTGPHQGCFSCWIDIKKGQSVFHQNSKYHRLVTLFYSVKNLLSKFVRNGFIENFVFDNLFDCQFHEFQLWQDEENSISKL